MLKKQESCQLLLYFCNRFDINMISVFVHFSEFKKCANMEYNCSEIKNILKKAIRLLDITSFLGDNCV